MTRTQSTTYSYLSAYITENILKMNCKRNDNDARNAQCEGLNSSSQRYGRRLWDANGLLDV